MGYVIDYTGSGLDPKLAAGGNPAVKNGVSFNAPAAPAASPATGGRVPYNPPSATPTPTPAPAKASTPAAPIASPYYPRNPSPTPVGSSNTTGVEQGLNTATENLAPTKPPSEDDIFKGYYAQSQEVINAINEAEAAAESAANIKSTKDTSASNFAMNALGLAGSSEANSVASGVEGDRLNAIATAKASKAKSLGDFITGLHTAAQAQANVERTRSDTMSAAYILEKQQKAQQSVKAAAMTGHTLDEIQQADPAGYNLLLQSYNGDANAMKADWVAAAQPNSLDGGKPIQAGSHLIFTFKDPTTGKVFTQDVDTGVALTTDYTVTKDADGGMWLTNKATGEARLLNGGSGGTGGGAGGGAGSIAASRAALTISRYSMASNRIVSNYLKLPAYTYLAGASPMLSRIEAAIGQTGSVSDNDLLDSVIKLNTGGNQITEAQVSTITGGQSYADWANVMKKKVSDQGGVLSDDQRKQLYDLSHAVYKKYQEAYKPVYDAASKQLKDAGIPKQYWTLPDLSNMSTIGGTTTTIPQSLSNTTDNLGNQVTPGDTVQDDAGNSYTVGANGDLTPAQ